MNQRLGTTARDEIRTAMQGLTGTAAKQEAERQAAIHGCSWKYIYGMTEDLREGNRKQRSDAGKRKYELVPGTDVFTAASLVIGGKLDPDQALLTHLANHPDARLPAIQYFRNMLREKDLSRKQRLSKRRAFRPWEAENPGQLIQVDCTALKVRWQDEKTRRILRIVGVDKNHPDPGDNKIRVWQIMAVDDHSRRRHMRYVATRQVTSRDMVEFACELFCLWGVPREVYTDNGSEFKGYFIRAEKILSKILDPYGGYIHTRHLPNNSQASGKVENAHKWAEKMDRYIGLAIAKGEEVTFEKLNPFADEICNFYNTQRVHRATGQTPLARWTTTPVLLRKIPSEDIRSALLSDERTVTLDPSMTIAFDGKIYRIPGVQPFVNFIGQKVKVVVPMTIDLILITLPDNTEWEIEKLIATPDNAGEFKSVAESTGQQLQKQLKEKFKADNAADKEKKKLTGEIYRVPHFNYQVEVPATPVLNFPHPEVVITTQEVNAVTPIPQTVYAGVDFTYWKAVGTYSDRFKGGTEEAKDFLLGLFPGEQGVIPSLEIEAAIDDRFKEAEPARLKAVG